MSTAVIEVGPVSVHGPGPVSADLAAAAVAGIDDQTALVEDEPAALADLWVEVLDAAASGATDRILVCPTWWTADQCDRVRDAARSSGSEAVVMQRVQALRAPLASATWAVVEIADALVMVSAADSEPLALARHPGADVAPESVVRAVIGIAGASAEVTVDAPPEVVGAVAMGRAVVAGLSRRGAAAGLAVPDTWRDRLHTPNAPTAECLGGRRARAGRIAIGTAAVVAAGLGGLAVAGHGRPPPGPLMTVLVEGRVGMQVPAGWAVDRVIEGPGSARVQVVSPTDPQVRIHLTQSGVGEGTVADILQRGLRDQPAGVFVDFDPDAVIAARPVVSYREVRAGREIRWAVFVDGAVRIAIGCQSSPGNVEAVRPACEAATRSAHTVF